MALSTFLRTCQHFHILKHLGFLVFHCVENLSIKFDSKEVLKILYIITLISGENIRDTWVTQGIQEKLGASRPACDLLVSAAQPIT